VKGIVFRDNEMNPPNHLPNRRDTNDLIRDRSMSANTFSNQSMGDAKSCGLSSTSSVGSFAGSTLSLEERKYRVIKYWEKKK
jgi:hypothetical protein